MKCIRTIVAALLVLSFAAISCTQEIDEVNTRLDNLEQRVSALEAIAKASENGDVIVSVTQIQDNGVLVGYHIEFQKGNPVDVFFGKDGKDGDSMFQSVTETDTEVTFVTADGQTFIIKRASALSIEFDSADLVVMGTNSTRDIHYTITSAINDITIEALSSADIKVKVVKTDAKTGALNVKTGAAIDEYSKVVVLVSNGSQAIMRTLNFEAEAIEVEENTTKEVSDEGGEIELEFFSNVPCHAVIPEDAQSWISVAPETKVMEKQTIGLIVQPNTGDARSATVLVKSENGTLSLQYSVRQEMKGGMVYLYSYWLLPGNVDKSKITDVSFIVNSEKTTDIQIPSNSNRSIFFELDGTTAKYYTKAAKYELIAANRLFYGWTSLEGIDLTNIETTPVTDMSNMFADCISLKSIILDDFCTANVNNMSGMFSNCWSLESLDLSEFITSHVNNMSYMFAGCSSLKTLDLSSFDTSNVEDMSGMFGGCFPQSVPYYQGNALVGCCSLESLDLHSFNTGKVRDMIGMFRNASNLKFINLSGWDTSNVENIGDMFMGCVSLESVDLSSFDTQKVTWMGHVFDGCSNLKSLDLSNFNTSQVTSMQSMFAFCESLQSLNISSFDASNLTDAMELVRDAVHMKHLDLGVFDLSNVSIIDASFAALSFKRKAVAIRCIDATKQIIENFADGYYFNIDNVTWVGIDEPFPDLPDVVDPSLYCSEDFSMDKTVKILQSATLGNGIDIVIMGDAYSDRLIADGTYECDMREAIDAIFEMEPMKSYKDLFNVYMVYAVSENEVHEGSTALGVYKQTGNSDICKAYTRRAISNKPLSDIAIIVIGHDREAFPETIANVLTVYSFLSDEYNDYGQSEYSIAFCGKTGDTQYDANTFVHEFGHLFAKLADEYERNDEAIGSSNEYEIPNLIDLCLHTGAYKNIDLTSAPETIKWNRFLADPRYVNENLGAYEGGLLYSKGVWRPNENSIMRTGTVFNAPSREAIYYRIHKLAYGEDWQYDYETFVQQDLKNIPVEPYFQASPKYVPSQMRKPQKHLFKIEESIATDGKKMVTVIMD